MKPNDEGIQVAHFISEVTLRPGLNTVAADFLNAWCEQNSGSALAAHLVVESSAVTNAALRRDFLHHGVRYAREIVGDALDRSEQR